MIRFFRIAAFFLIFIFLTAPKIFAQSSYVLPYPCNMPGSLIYKIHLIYEGISKYWYFGDFGQFNYSLKLSDKYLVEAKTLFEYKQYLLGHKALKKSDRYFVDILPHLIKAEKNGKNILQKEAILKEASLKHVEILWEMRNNVPGTFVWKPENSNSTALNLKEAIDLSIQLREKKS